MEVLLQVEVSYPFRHLKRSHGNGVAVTSGELSQNRPTDSVLLLISTGLYVLGLSEDCLGLEDPGQ